MIFGKFFEREGENEMSSFFEKIFLDGSFEPVIEDCDGDSVIPDIERRIPEPHEMCPVHPDRINPDTEAIIDLTCGFYTVVSRKTYERLGLGGHTWHASIRTKTGKVYAVRRRKRDEPYTKETIYLHREVMGVVDAPEIHIDHVRGYPLDNRDDQLRYCNGHQDNNHNSVRKERGETGSQGVYHRKMRNQESNQYEAYYNCNGIRHCCGSYPTEKQAAYARDRVVVQLLFYERGVPARIVRQVLNDPDLLPEVDTRDARMREDSLTDDIPF